MKLTRHNGRSGKNGTYNPKHNDRRFDVKNSEHIDQERVRRNVYWDCYQGYHYPEDQEQEEKITYSFDQVEKIFYHRRYNDFCEAQHERNRKNGHPERDRITEDLRMDKRTCPEESLIQIGTIEQSVSPETLERIAVEFFQEMERRFGEHVHILDWALHLDEATPHIHERHVFDCVNRYGEIAPQQEKALEALGFELSDPDCKPGKNNNRKMAFDAACRTLLFDITLKHGLHLDQEPSYGGRKYLEKNDYIIEKQNRKIEEQGRELKKGDELRDTQKKLLLSGDIELFRKTQASREEGEKLEEIRQATGREKERLEETRQETGREMERLEVARQETSREEEKLEETKQRTSREEERFETMSSWIRDKEAFIDDVAEYAYNAAVKEVNEKVIEETHNADFNLIVRFRERMKIQLADSPSISRMISIALGNLLREFSGVTKHISEKLAEIFGNPVQKEKMKKPIKDAIRQRLEYEETYVSDYEEPEHEISRGMSL